MTIRKFILAKFPEFNLNYQYSESDLETGRNIVYEFICSIMRGTYGKEGTIYSLSLTNLERALIALTIVDSYFSHYQKKLYVDCEYNDKENMIVLMIKKECD